MTSRFELALAAPEPTIADIEAAIANPVLMDLETRSSIDLWKHGPWRYLEDAEILSGAWLQGNTLTLQTARPINLDAVRPKVAAELGYPDLEIVVGDPPPGPWWAHNGWGFDTIMWHGLGNRPEVFLDTMPLARGAGLPGGLDAIGHSVFNRGKDARGAALMKRLCKPLKATGEYPPLNRSNMTALARYMIVDVLIMARSMKLFFYWLERCRNEWPNLLADYRINRRGVRLDTSLAQEAVDYEAGIREDSGETVARIVGLESATDGRSFLRSLKKLGAWLETRGLELPDCTKDTLLDVLESGEELDEDVETVIRARLGESTTTTAKLEAALRRVCPDGRLRNELRFHGAHTGRWTGAGTQLHNLVKGDQDPDESVVALRERRATPKELRSLVRMCFGAGKIADLSGIEARGSRWLAADPKLELFRDPKWCIYRNAAGAIFGIDPDDVEKWQRTVGKVAELAGQYQGGPGAVARFAAIYRLDVDALGLDAQQIVDRWRDDNPLIAGVRTGEEWNGHILRSGGLWKDYEAAFEAATRGYTTSVGPVTFGRDSGDNIVELPSGRIMVYRRARVELRPAFGRLKPTLVFDGEKWGQVLAKETYGGSLLENLNQALCRDIFAYGLLLMERAGLEPVFHVHDEIVWQSDELRRGLELMTQVPPWCPGFPLGAAGFESDEYRKEPGDRAELKFLDGMEL